MVVVVVVGGGGGGGGCGGGGGVCIGIGAATLLVAVGAVHQRYRKVCLCVGGVGRRVSVSVSA